MQNKYLQALISAVIYAIVFPFIYRMSTGSSLAADSIAVSTVIFFVVMLMFFNRREQQDKKA